ncbi:hypothetical protein A9975_30130 [Cupriavidus sp. UME77]|nr:hypothetical protein [Cupriavidus sp. UME77]
MSSREIAELVEKRHDNVKRTIETLAARNLVRPQIEDEQGIDAMGRHRDTQVYRVGKRDSYVIVAQLSPDFTARLVDRWQELEQQAAPAIPQSLPEALRLAADEAEKRIAVEAKLSIAAPKADGFDRIAAADGIMNLTGAAKTLQLQPVKFCQKLREIRWIYRRAGGKSNVAYQDKILAGYLVHKTVTTPGSDGSEVIREQVMVTPKGLAKLALLLGQSLDGAA